MTEDITERIRAQEALQQSQQAERRLREKLEALHEVAHELSRTDTFDDLCRRAVELGREKLGLDRMSLWFLTDDPAVIRGSFGTDEAGNLRDERNSLVSAGEAEHLRAMLDHPTRLWVNRDAPLFNEKLQAIGRGESIVAALWDGQRIMGFLFVDNLLSRRVYDAGYLEVIKLFAADVEQMASRNRAQERLRQSEARYRGLVESQTDLIVRVDPQGRFTYVNDAYCRKFGKTRDELLGHTYMPLVHPDDLPETLEAMKGLAQPPYRVRVEQRAMTPEGYRWLDWEDYALRDGAGRIVEIQAVGRDITQRKGVEAAVTALHAQLITAREDERRRLARDLHDSIGQQMIAMGYALQGAINELQSPPQGIQAIPRQVNNLVHEVRQICHGLYPPTLESLGLPRSLLQLANDCHARMEILLEVQPALQTARFGHDIEIALFRIAQEAVQNALRHSQATRIVIHLGQSGHWLEMSVEDNGRGFDVQQAIRGLGLNTMRHRARVLGGDVDIASAPGRTRIICRLPLAGEGAVDSRQ